MEYENKLDKCFFLLAGVRTPIVKRLKKDTKLQESLDYMLKALKETK